MLAHLFGESKERDLTTSEYARKLVELIEVRSRNIDLDKLLYEVYVLAKIAEAEREIEQGRWSTHEQAMERMWEPIHSKFCGQ
jgi:predicted transcriptional regulator